MVTEGLFQVAYAADDVHFQRCSNNVTQIIGDCPVLFGAVVDPFHLCLVVNALAAAGVRHDKACLYGDEFGNFLAPAYGIYQLDCFFCNLFTLAVNSSGTGNESLTLISAVKARENDILGHTHTSFFQRFVQSHHHIVVRTDYRLGSFPVRRKEEICRFFAFAEPEVALEYA